jgi:hypothetical protein
MADVAGRLHHADDPAKALEHPSLPHRRGQLVGRFHAVEEGQDHRVRFEERR